MNLTEKEKIRYKRHITLPEIGVDGQERIKCSKVLIIGVGGLGSPIALYLAAAGVGTIGIIDGDNVDLSNLQRQVIHTTQDIDKPKTSSAKEKMLAINPSINVVTYSYFLDNTNASEIINNYDFIIDATDSFNIKMLINDTCILLNKPYSHGGISQYQGQTMTIIPGSACLRSLIDSIPEGKNEEGTFGVIPGIIGTIQATEALKYITGVGELLTNRLLTFDALTMQFDIYTINNH